MNEEAYRAKREQKSSDSYVPKCGASTQKNLFLFENNILLRAKLSL
jgi:hypothetical protein